MEWLDPSVRVGAYFSSIADALVKLGPYQRDLSLRGAPYDFRKAPSKFFFFTLFSKLFLNPYLDFRGIFVVKKVKLESVYLGSMLYL